MLLRYNPPRAERARGAYHVGRYRQPSEEGEELLAYRGLARVQDQERRGAVAEAEGREGGETAERRGEKRVATRRNGYEEIPPPVIPS